MTRRRAAGAVTRRPPRPLRPWVVPAIAAALAAVLSSGLTAAYFISTAPESMAMRGDLFTTAEERHVAALLVAPADPYRPVSEGSPVDAAALDAEGLVALGFERGWTRGWRTPGGEKVDAFVLEFADSRGASAYANGVGRAARLLAKPQPFTVAGVPGSSGLSDTVRDRQGRYAQLVALHDGPYAVLLVFATDEAAPGAEVVEMAQRQWAALRAA